MGYMNISHSVPSFPPNNQDSHVPERDGLVQLPPWRTGGRISAELQAIQPGMAETRTTQQLLPNSPVLVWSAVSIDLMGNGRSWGLRTLVVTVSVTFWILRYGTSALDSRYPCRVPLPWWWQFSQSIVPRNSEPEGCHTALLLLLFGGCTATRRWPCGRPPFPVHARGGGGVLLELAMTTRRAYATCGKCQVVRGWWTN